MICNLNKTFETRTKLLDLSIVIGSNKEGLNIIKKIFKGKDDVYLIDTSFKKPYIIQK